MKITILRRLTPIVLSVLALSPLCRAQSRVAGDWLGTLNTGGPQLHLVLHIAADKDGKLTATLDSVDQGANGIPVSAISLVDSKLSIAVDAVHGTYEGTVNKESTEIAGTWSQGQPLELNFKRAPAQSAAPAAAQPSKPGLDGLDDFVTQAMKDWKVPGLALAVIQGDKVILKKGYGLPRYGESSCRSRRILSSRSARSRNRSP